jgi:hypothetical protein
LLRQQKKHEVNIMFITVSLDLDRELSPWYNAYRPCYIRNAQLSSTRNILEVGDRFIAVVLTV